MPRERSCDYCGADIEPGTGTMFVHVDGRVVHYCSSKCENNADLGRASRDLEWTAEGQRVGASRAGTPEEVEQVAADPPEEESETVADEMDTTEAESEAEAVAAAAGDAGSRSGDPAAATDERVDDDATADTDELDEVAGRRAGGNDPDIDEDVTPIGEGAPGEETDPEEAAVNVDDEETTRETDDAETEFDADDTERTSDETVSQDEADEVVTDEEREETGDDE